MLLRGGGGRGLWCSSRVIGRGRERGARQRVRMAWGVPAWSDVERRAAQAAEVGAMVSIYTRSTDVVDGGVAFEVRLATSLAKSKPKGTAAAEGPAGSVPKRNPFLPYDEELFVCDAGDHHVLLLNKFNVVQGHLLVVTRAFESQDDALNARDMAALWPLVRAHRMLGFFNYGPLSGQSQPHKHMQAVPLSSFAGSRLPLSSVVDELGKSPRSAFSIRSLPFANRCAVLDPERETPEGLEALVSDLVAYFQGRYVPGRDGLPSYNLLLTPTLVAVFPRGAEEAPCASGLVNVNSLGFAGTLLAKEQAVADEIVRVGPLKILQAVGIPSLPSDF